MKVIYEPTGRAKEYSPLALNIYKGCQHGCLYCYAPSAMHTTKENYFTDANPKKDLISNARKNAAKLRGDDREINLSFIGDPYQPAETELKLTRQIIKILIENHLYFNILTKGGTRATRDFDLLSNYEKCKFGTTLVFLNQKDADHWEPGAANIKDRISAIKEAYAKGIKTWVSLEPVIDPSQTLQIIRLLYPIVDHWKIGKLNYNKEVENRVDWLKFRSEVASLLNSFDAGYYIKDSLSKL